MIRHASSDFALSGGSHAFQAAAEVSVDSVLTLDGGTSQIESAQRSLTALVNAYFLPLCANFGNSAN